MLFGNQGDLYLNAMTWWDHPTGSVWSQPRGEAILGPRRGRRLELVPSTLTTWAGWREAHPATLALDARGGTGGFALEEMVVVVDFGGDAAAYPVPLLQEAGVVNDEVAGEPIAVVVDPDAPDRWAVLSRRAGDRTVTLHVAAGRLVDRETGTAWDPVRGLGRDGPLAGESLALLPGFTAFPWEYRNIWPGGRLWDGGPEARGEPVDLGVNPFRSTLRD